MAPLQFLPFQWLWRSNRSAQNHPSNLIDDFLLRHTNSNQLAEQYNVAASVHHYVAS